MADVSGATAEHPVAALEVDDEAVETDSTYSKDLSTYTSSLTSSALDYREENGRRYHAYRDGRYLMPNDNQESERLDMAHELSLTVMGRKLYYAPVDPAAQRVLDLCTGTGMWATDYADQHPSAEVIGTDLSPTQPNLVPQNVKFQVDDAEDAWTFEPDYFDFIHARYLASSVLDFPKLMGQCYRHAKPGGWVEFQDWDLKLESDDGSTKGTTLEKYFSEVLGSYENAGYSTRPGHYLKQWVSDAGFQGVQSHHYRVPIGIWPKDPHMKKIGGWAQIVSEQGLVGGAMAVLTRYRNWDPEEVKVLAAQAKKDMWNSRIHGIINFSVVYGQKAKNA